MEHHADLFQTAVAAVVPKQPFRAVEDCVGLVARVVIPFVFAGSHDGIAGMALPIRDAVARARKADLRVRFIPEADVKHHMPVANALHLAGSDFVLFPKALRIGHEDRIRVVFLPHQTVRTRGVADGVGLVLLAAGIPHPEQLRFRIPQNMRAHDGDFFPRLHRRQDRFLAHSLPRHAISAGRIADGGMALRLAGVP